jgi:uncharacterized protein YggE
MSRWIGAAIVAVLALVVAGVIGTAGAQDTTPTTAAASLQRLITVNGAGEASVASDANAAARDAAYRTALTSALDDAKAKAGLIAAHEGLTVGAIQSVTEQSNGLPGGCAIAYGAAGKGVAVPAPAPVFKPAVRRPAHRRLRQRRTAALRGTPMPLPPQPYPCDAQASVTVSYTVS